MNLCFLQTRNEKNANAATKHLNLEVIVGGLLRNIRTKHSTYKASYSQTLKTFKGINSYPLNSSSRLLRLTPLEDLARIITKICGNFSTMHRQSVLTLATCSKVSCCIISTFTDHLKLHGSPGVKTISAHTFTVNTATAAAIPGAQVLLVQR